jgi:hypothetical protein
MTRILRILIWLASFLAIVVVSTLGSAPRSHCARPPVESEIRAWLAVSNHPGPLYDQPTQARPASVMPGCRSRHSC